MEQVKQLEDLLNSLDMKGFSLKHVRAGQVSVGDYLVYEDTNFWWDAEKDRDVSKVCIFTGLVIATGGEQGSGPRPSTYWVALEGNPDIKQLDGRAQHTVVRPKK